MNPSLQLKERIYQATLDRPSRTRRERRVREGGILAAAIAASLAVFFAFGGVRPGPRPLPFVAGTVLGLVALATAATWIACFRGRSMLGRPAAWLGVVAVGVPIILFVWMFAWGHRYPSMAAWWPSRPGFRCLGLSLLIGAWPLAALMFARRRTELVHSRATGAALGAAVGAWTAVLIDMWCPVAHPAHVALGHALPIILLASVGGWVGARVLAPSAMK